MREFIAITDVDGERARFFLESAGWDLQVRVDPPSPGPGRKRLGGRSNKRSPKIKHVKYRKYTKQVNESARGCRYYISR